MEPMTWTEPRATAFPSPVADEESGWADEAGARVPASILFLGPRGIAADLKRAGSVRIVEHVPAGQAASHLRQMTLSDILWVAAAETIEEETLAAIFDAAAEMECALVCETPLTALDRIAAMVPASVRIEWLVDADAADRLAALAAASRSAGALVHDVARDEAMERIDRLQDEVARISRLLGELAGRRGLPGTPPGGFAPRGEDAEDHGGALHSPVRDYAAIPRSFGPEERMVQRQRAKAVRRMLRQRRMREQYFPADLFADPAWDMLLDLYAARLERQPVSVSSLCIAAAVPATTALRWIKTMTDAGLFLREADPSDGRRIFLALAEGAYDAMARYFEALEE
ncbi:MAG TPA: MarR family transcriptional regulator [Sphingopyxis sp.]|nr:MarR family transcriptional regulator [Sphingopyxis sp.]HMP45453.1 MarR family transcriptional regulator [Sphingopyxis sp.]HMQ18740.1 MarR family transcriptional regulator [Sphingopyxis sp.]